MYILDREPQKLVTLAKERRGEEGRRRGG